MTGANYQQSTKSISFFFCVILLSMPMQIILAESLGENIEPETMPDLTNHDAIYNLTGQGAIPNPTGYINGMSGQFDRGDGLTPDDDAWTMTNHPEDQLVESHYSRDSEGNLYFLHHQSLRYTKHLSHNSWLTRAGVLDVVSSIFDVEGGKTYLRKMNAGTIGFANYQYELPERHCFNSQDDEVWPFDQHPLGDVIGIYHAPDDTLIIILGYTYRISGADAISLESAELGRLSCTLDSDEHNFSLSMNNSMAVMTFDSDGTFLDFVFNEGFVSPLVRGTTHFALDTQLTPFFVIEPDARDASPVKLIFSENGSFSLPIIEYGGNCIDEKKNYSLCYFLAEFDRSGRFESMLPIFETPSRFISHFRSTFDSSKLCFFAVNDEDGIIDVSATLDHTSGSIDLRPGENFSIYHNPKYEVGMIDLETLKIDWLHQNLDFGQFNRRVNLDCSNQFATLNVQTNEYTFDSESYFNNTFNGSGMHSIILIFDGGNDVRVFDPLESINNFIEESLHNSNIINSQSRDYIETGHSYRVDGNGILHLVYSAVDYLPAASMETIVVGSMGYLKYDLESESILYHENAEIEDRIGNFLPGANNGNPTALISTISEDGSVILQFRIKKFDYSNVTFLGEIAPINPIIPEIGLYHENILTIYGYMRDENWMIEFKDSDHDGIRDKQDPCPNSPQTWPEFDSTDRDRDGCHDETQDDDDDGDGIFDWEDNCPQGDIDWIPDAENDADGDGCQDATEDEDDDADGISDIDDECADQPNSWQSNTQFDSDRNGCLDDDWAWWYIQEIPELEDPTISEEPISGSTSIKDNPTTLAKLKQTISTPAGMAGIGMVSLVAIAGVSIAYASGHQPLQFRLNRRSSSLGLTGLIGGIKHSREPEGIEQRAKAMALIEENPGIHYSELRRLLNWGGGQLVHHLSVMERDGDIWRHPSGKLLLIFPRSVRKEDISPTFLELLSILKQKDRDILALLWQDELRELNQNDIADWFALSESTVSRHLNKMKELGLVRIENAGRYNSLFITNMGIELITLGD